MTVKASAQMGVRSIIQLNFCQSWCLAACWATRSDRSLSPALFGVTPFENTVPPVAGTGCSLIATGRHLCSRSYRLQNP